MDLRQAAAVAGFLAWAGCMVVGFGMLQNYAAVAGATGTPGENLPLEVAAQRAPQRGLIIMATHPLCPCTDASLSELGTLLARSLGRCDALLLEYRPATPPTDWPDSPVTRELGGVRVRVLADHGGDIARTLGARTSGHIVFLDASGVIRFHGGLTRARGHEGRVPAQEAILAVLGGDSRTIAASPVFGCALEAECGLKPAS